MSRGPAPKRGDTQHARLNFEDSLLSNVDGSSNANRVRPSRDAVLMDVAYVIAKRGTCSRSQVGAVLARDGRIITTGYNGAPAGMAHCDHRAWGKDFGAKLDASGHHTIQPPQWVVELWLNDDTCSMEDDDTLNYYTDGQSTIVNDEPSAPGCTISEHAERNAIAYAARYGLGTDGATLYCTHAPCVDCARAIINSGVSKVLYKIPYRLTQGLQLLGLAGVEVEHMPY